ncbi:mycofactocin-coupled SDR family oxidoreductase [Rhodococcus erythropolis]|jgi:(+)-trans-carveol dehydrogenase|uniref:3-ketoacyl-ACP reductase n=2 Tax=Rhodococcus erythropolis TaxID=1833 RepID=A0A5N5E4Z5_RHOER|nr:MULTISPECIES: mycofactocin-coupled SDR family oxidoreductase [Rhodococcus]ALU67807.1 NAD-dependent oxidoreductase [Rhodococcus erythropolis R138]KAB2585509.1 3-ketoacyl-ACP reductase [Rhodococcus erythropolis]MBJ7480162.1 mycofactocin-coupled SDR family oxidoreductase [Rhodococcus sp. (in: high G+C Gram-positive bacteria)]MCQ4126836.1 mycofactocin-coupled SDR family oxidoreductase [Rhodococcus erythropolis]MCW2298812.1 (+)-trans-carveol dehydrogenase [Rhodococcus erythropolis]
MTGRFEGKVAFITGAARGQGRNHALRLAQEGANIIALDSVKDNDTVPYPLATEDDVQETIRLVEEAGGKIIFSHADVRNFDSVKLALEAGLDRFGHVDIVIANAGILSFGNAHELDEEKWGEMIDVNLSGVWRTVKAAIPHMIEQGTGGAIVLTASVAGLRAYTGVGHYVSAKHGVVGLMKTLAQELAPHRIRVNTVNPTQVDTEMVQNQAMYNQFVPGTDNPGRDDFAKASGDMILYPIPWVENDDVTNAVKFLASDEARYITGVALPVDGGVLVM